MKYTEKEKKLVTNMITEFNKVHNREKRLELVWWYSFASGIKNDEKVRKIMEDIGAI